MQSQKSLAAALSPIPPPRSPAPAPPPAPPPAPASGRAPLPPSPAPSSSSPSSSSSCSPSSIVPSSSSSTAAAFALAAAVGDASLSLPDFPLQQQQQQRQQQQRQLHHLLALSPSSSSSQPHFGDSHRHSLPPAWHQQQQQQQHQQQHHHHHHQQQQQQQQHQQQHPQQQQHLGQFLQSVQQYRKSTSNEQLVTYQGGVYQGVGGSGSGPPGGPQSLLLPPEAYTDVAQQQLPAQGVNQQLQAQAYLQQALYAAQNKAHASAQQGKSALISQAVNLEDLQNLRQLQARQGQVPISAFNKEADQFLAKDQHMDPMHDNRNDPRTQQCYATQSMPNMMRSPAGALQNQQQLLVNGHPQHAGVPQMRVLQPHLLDPNSGALLASHAQYIHPQMLPQLQAQLAAMQKAADVGAAIQHLHPTTVKAQANLSTSGQDIGMANRVLPNAQHGTVVVDGHSVSGMMMGKAHQNVSGGVVGNPNFGHLQYSVVQPVEYSIDRGVLSLNRPGNAAATSVPVPPSKRPIAVPLPQKTDKASVSSPEKSQVHYGRQQHLQGSLASSNEGQASNSLISQHQQSSPPLPPQHQHPLPQQGIHYQQQQGSQYQQPQQQGSHYQQPQQQGSHYQQPQYQQGNHQQQPQHQHQQGNQHQQPQGNHHQQPQHQRFGFTRQQLMVLKSQILAFRRLKRGEQTLPMEVLRSIGPPPLSSQQNHAVMEPAAPTERASSLSVAELQPSVEKEVVERQGGTLGTSTAIFKHEGKVQEVPMQLGRKETSNLQQSQVNSMVDVPIAASVKQDQTPVTAKPTLGQAIQAEHAVKDESIPAKNMTMPSRPTTPTNLPLAAASSPVNKPTPATSHPQKASQVMRRYRGPLYDFPPIGRKVEPALFANNPWGSPTFGFDVRQLLLEEGVRVVDKKRAEKLKVIDALLATGLEKKLLPTELILKLRIEQRKLRLMALQSRIREEVEEQQQEIMAMGERGYRKFIRLCERQRADLARQMLLLQKTTRERQLKSLFQWRKRLLEAHWAIRDARTTRNRGVAKYHERMLREFSKKRDEDRNRRMEALKNNDVDSYREMLKQQQTKLPGDAGERFEVLSSFLSQTEDYLHKLGGKISAVKTQQEREEAAIAATEAARAQGLSEEEIEAAAAHASEEVDARIQSPDMAPVSVNKYYSLAHAVTERIVRQPSMLRAGILRDYQLVGLQWMLSLYNNRLNGILADEMGLGKTVQVMALIAYLMEFKGNYGPHLIIVPNAVIVNWKSELLRWIPSVSCIFYVGGKEQRSKLFTQEVCAMKFNVLVTTYEFIMRDRSKLSKVDWKYLIIDEAQRMKDRESRLARDLDRFRCQRRLLLTGTPLQNDLRELWSLLNLLLPEVFDNSKAFHDWFSTPFQKDGSSQSLEDDWLETEKKVIVIHRLHQILEPFMLRRRVEDVEGSLPPKVPVVLRCKMSALQAAIYDWIKATGTIRLDPDDEAVRMLGGNGKRQMRAYTPLQNKCMELRKVCNHPFLNYPLCGDRVNAFAVRSCGKLWILDRILVKLQKTGHRVLLFSTMTRLLDILEEYLQWRGLIYRRIDGTTTLESRESAITEFNRPGSDCFIFLLSIRAAGRGLNLQSADTVIIYDPDANPKNEEQAVARAHRIGQKREVRVIYMEAVVETIASYQKEDEIRSGGTVDMDDDDMAGKDRYVGSVESLVRNTIQQHKIDMADEVINAGRFDQQTTQEERRLTLEALVHDEERYQERVHDVPSLQEVNRMIARTDEEVDLFDQMDEENDWPGEMLQHHQIPKWLRVGSREVNAAMAAMSRQASKKGVVEAFGMKEEEERMLSEPFDMVLERAPDKGKKQLSVENIITEADKDEEALEENEQKVEKDASDDEEEGEIREDFEEEENDALLITEQEEGELSEEELESGRGQDVVGPTQDIVEVLQKGQNEGPEVASESSHDEEEEDMARHGGEAGQTPPTSQKFASLAALDSRQATQSVAEELEEGEIAASGDSPFDGQPSESWAHTQEEGEEEQVVQPRTKRKRSARQHRRRPLDKLDESGSCNFHDARLLPSYQFPQWPNYGLDRQAYEADRHCYQLDRQMFELDRQVQRFDDEGEGAMESMYWRPDQWGPPVKRRHLVEPILPTRPIESFPPPQLRILPKHSKVTGFSEQDDDVNELTRENVNSKTRMGSSPSCVGGGRMPEHTQKKCKAVLQKLQGAVDKEGRQIATLFELPKRSEVPGYYKVIANPIDARTIEQHLDRLEYGSVLDFAADVQLMLDNAARHYNSIEVKADARRLQALFFQRMGLHFPDVDFGCVKTRTLATLSQPLTPCGSSPRQQSNQSGAGKPQAETGTAIMDRPSKKVEINEERVPDKGGQKKGKKVHKNSKVTFTERAMEREKVKSEEERARSEDSEGEVRHPVDLVFRKKKRKDRGKVANKVRTIGAEIDNSVVLKNIGKKVRTGGVEISSSAGDLKGHVGIKGSRPPPARKVQAKSQPGSSKVSVPLGGDQWLTPVKKMRTDGGKRRPSHL